MVTIYHYDRHTKAYCGTTKARLSPVDLKKGKEVPLVPAFATLEEPSGKQDVYDEDSRKWKVPPILPGNKITLHSAKQISPSKLEEEVHAVFTGVRVSYSVDDPQQRGSKEVFFDNIVNLPENSIALEEILSNHDFSSGRLSTLRAERNKKLCDTDWIIRRHDDQKAASLNTTITESEYQEWLVYRQQLRDFPTTCDVINPVWPSQPA